MCVASEDGVKSYDEPIGVIVEGEAAANHSGLCGLLDLAAPLVRDV